MSGIFRTITRRVRRGSDDEGIALLLVILAMLTVTSLSLLVMGTLLAQITPTQFQQKNTTTANAAEAGLAAGLAAIRNSTSPDPTVANEILGDRGLLPCWTNYTGTVGGPTATTLTWSTTIKYYAADPSGQTQAWRTTNAFQCTSGLGPPVTPNFALVTSNGVAPALPRSSSSAGNRTLETVYTFRLTNQNVSGGLIHIGSLCLAATSGTPAVGTGVSVTTCVPGAPSQLWAYRQDFTVQLTASQTSVATAGLCIDAYPGAAGTDTNIATKMQTCDGTSPRQRWGISDAREMFGHLTNVFSGKWCFRNDASVLKASTSCGTQVTPEPEVGAGAAGSTSNSIDGVPLQWVNYREFGRCLDITDWQVSPAAYPGGRPSEIAYPCKQDPMRDSLVNAQPGWNEVFTYEASTRLFFLNKDANANRPNNPANPRYCMKSPNSAGGYVQFFTDCTTASTAYQWTINRDTGSSTTNYTIVDGYGRCLSVGTPNPSYGYPWSSIVTATCDGTPGQKWNAPPGLQDAPVNNTRENVFVP